MRRIKNFKKLSKENLIFTLLKSESNALKNNNNNDNNNNNNNKDDDHNNTNDKNKLY